MHRNVYVKTVLSLVLGATALMTANVASAGTLDISATAGNGWVAILPPDAATNNGYPSPDYLDATSQASAAVAAFNANNVGWNSSAAYDASAWTAYDINNSHSGWIESTGLNPFFARYVFNINGTSPTGTFTTGVDDDSWVYVNGTLAFQDNSHGTDGPFTFSLTPYLQSGQNVIAFVADNSAGGGFGVFAANGSVTFEDSPEPMSMSLAGLGFLMVVGAARRRKQA